MGTFKLNPELKPTAELSLYQTLRTALLGMTVLALIAFSGCNSNEDGMSCGPSDQWKSFMAPIGGDSPAKIALDQSFSLEQKQLIQEAAGVWNAFGQQSLHRDFFQVEEGSVAALNVPSNQQDCEAIAGNGGDFQIAKLGDDGRWSSLGMTTSNPGVTIRCYSNNELQKQVILINPENSKPEQFKSVLLHELGHALGLNHSCEFGSTNPNYASCTGLSRSHPYRMAVMFPVLTLSAYSIETKEDLRSNDQERAQCLYHP